MNTEQKKWYDEGQEANDHNKRLTRNEAKGFWKGNPYPKDSEQWLFWYQGYNYRGMVNDG